MSAEGAAGDQARADRQFSIPVGLMFGLLAAAVLCLGYAWWHRNPEMALRADRADITSMLWRTTMVVAISAVLTVGGFLLGRLHRQFGDHRAKFLSYVSPALVILGVGGFYALNRGQTAQAFEGAAKAQQALIPFEVTTVARIAWWCACLAVMALAFVAVGSYLAVPPPAAEPRRLYRSLGMTAAVALTVASIVATTVVMRTGTPNLAQTAGRIDAPTLASVSGAVAYRVKRGKDAPIPAGAGFVSVVDTDLSDSVEGFDGATGQRVWVFNPGGLNIYGAAATGVGPDSVLALRTYDGLIGLDATTGTPLWVRTGDGSLAGMQSAGLIMISHTDPGPPGPAAGGRVSTWEALAPRTGEVMWAKTFRYQCFPKGYLTERMLLLHSCDNAPEVVADVLDPATGEPKGALTLGALGLAPNDIGLETGSVTIDGVRGDRALVSVARYRPQRTDTRLVVDLPSGAIAARLPAMHDAEVLDATSVLLRPYRRVDELAPVSILDLDSGAIIQTGSFSRVLSNWDDGQRFWVRVGAEWVTFAPDEQTARAMLSSTGKWAAPLRAINAAGVVRTFGYPCAEKMQWYPGFIAVPGALLVRCPENWVAVN